MPLLKYVNIKSLGWKIKFVKFVKLRLRNLVPTNNDTVKMKLIGDRKLLPIFFVNPFCWDEGKRTSPQCDSGYFLNFKKHIISINIFYITLVIYNGKISTLFSLMQAFQ